MKQKYGYKGVKRNRKIFLQHRLIVERELGRKLDFNEIVHHINEVKDDNRLENLQVMSRSDHSRSHMSGQMIGSKNRNAKLTESMVAKIKKQLLLPHSTDDIAMEFGVTRGTINKIKRGECWSHVR